MKIGSEKLDLKKVKIPIYNLATREDHIAPATLGLSRLVVLRRAGDVRALRLRPHRRRGQSARARRSTSTGPARRRSGDNLDRWIAGATEHPGSWWPDWLAWLKQHASATEVDARAPGGGKLTPIEDAPGSYVKRAELNGGRPRGLQPPRSWRVEAHARRAIGEERMSRELFWLTLTVILTGPAVDPLHPRSRQGARPDGRDGQSQARRQAAVAVGDAALFRAHQRGRQPRHLRAAGADPRLAQHFAPTSPRSPARSISGRASRTRSSTRSASRCCARSPFTVGFLAQAVLVLAIFRVCVTVRLTETARPARAPASRESRASGSCSAPPGPTRP